MTILGIPYELVFFCEINNAAAKSFCAIHNVSEEKNLKDLTTLGESNLPKGLDLFIGGTPCQDFSLAGKSAGGDEGSSTRSSLMWNYLKIVEKIHPSIVVWENVWTVLTHKHYRNYEKFYYSLSKLGYKVYSQIINAKYFNVPQNRERIFIVAISNEIDSGFVFPQGYDSGIRIADILQDEFPQNVVTKRIENAELFKPKESNGTFKKLRCGNLHNNNYQQENYIMSIRGIAPCLMAAHDAQTGAKIYDDRPHIKPAVIRRFTALESFRLMSFTDEDYWKCRYKVENGKISTLVSETELYAQAGNSIVVNVLIAIFGKLFKVSNWEDKVYGQRKKTQKQLLDELPLFNYFNKNAA